VAYVGEGLGKGRSLSLGAGGGLGKDAPAARPAERVLLEIQALIGG
jgi:hypothetical protein